MFDRLRARAAEHPAFTRLPPPRRPWLPEYVGRHIAATRSAIASPELRQVLAAGQDLPAGYGAGFDERIVEFPWALAQGLGGRVLDAGSTLNHGYVLDALLPQVDDLHIVTLAPEPHAFWARGISYVFADLRALPYRDGWFDTVVSLSVLEHVGMDNALYGASSDRARDVADATRAAVQELRRVVRPGGRLLVSVPYGRAEDHGWFRQFGQEDLQDLQESAGATDATVEVFLHTSGGWQRSTAAAAGAVTYRDWRTDGRAAVQDRAAAARAVACLAFTF